MKKNDITTVASPAPEKKIKRKGKNILMTHSTHFAFWYSVIFLVKLPFQLRYVTYLFVFDLFSPILETENFIEKLYIVYLIK